jgi:hypothetical protein
MALLFVSLVVIVLELATVLFTGNFFDTGPRLLDDGTVRESVSGSAVLALTVPVVLLYGWFFWLLGNLFDLGWRVATRAFEPVLAIRGKALSLVYGPSSHRLARVLAGGPILLLTSRNDEADLLLQVGSTPGRLYREYVSSHFSQLRRVLEFVFIRPIVLGGLLEAVETVLEVTVFGFSTWRSLWLDHEVRSLDEKPYYPTRLLVHRTVEVPAMSDWPVAGVDVTDAGLGAMPVAPPGALRVGRGLDATVAEVIQEIRRQIQLRHSSYYENRRVVDQLADFLSGAELETRSDAPATARSLWPREAFWEALLVANIGLAILFATIAGRSTPFVLVLVTGITAYVIPLVILALAVAGNAAFRRRLPRRPWRWFWVYWSLWALAIINLAFQARRGF